MANPERPAVAIRRAVPVKGPGVAELPEAVPEQTNGKEKERGSEPHSDPPQEPATSLLPGSRRPTLEDLAYQRDLARFREHPSIRHHDHTVNLTTVLDMLDCVKATERGHLKEIIHLLSQLTPTARMRVLKAINGIFQ